jgi:large subunit ribosomal protein L13
MNTKFSLYTQTVFPKVECHRPKVFVIDAKGQTVGRLASLASQYLRGKNTSFYTPGVDQGNFVVILNSQEVKISGTKANDKQYFRNSQRPGSLKIENFSQLQSRIPTRILEEAIWGMLPKGILGRNYYRRLFVYANEKIPVRTLTTTSSKKQAKSIIHFLSFEDQDPSQWISLS